MKPHKEKAAKVRQAFLLTFFDSEGYEEKEVNGYWLVRSINGATGNPQVAVFSQESFKNYKEAGSSFFGQQDNHIKSIMK
jgi:hypothetical protein